MIDIQKIKTEVRIYNKNTKAKITINSRNGRYYLGYHYTDATGFTLRPQLGLFFGQESSLAQAREAIQVARNRAELEIKDHVKMAKLIEQEKKKKRLKTVKTTVDIKTGIIDYLEKWRDTYPASAGNRNNINSLINNVKLFKEWSSNPDITLVSPMHCDAFFKQMYGNENYADKTKETLLGWLKSFFKWCFETAEIIDRNPCSSCEVKKVRNDIPNTFTTEELLRLEQTPTDEKAMDMKPLFFFILQTAVRPVDAYSFKFSTLGRIVDGNYVMKNEYAFKNSKTGRFARIIKNDITEKILMEQWDKYGHDMDAHVFKRFQQAHQTVVWRKWLSDAKVDLNGDNGKPRVPYNAKHTGMSELAEMGANDRDIATLTGHTSSHIMSKYIKPQLERIAHFQEQRGKAKKEEGL